MILKISNNGERLSFYHADITKHTNLDNVLLVGKGIREIVDDINIRQQLLAQYGKNGVVYLLSPEDKDTKKQMIKVHSAVSAFDYNTVNLLDEIDLTTDIVPTILDRTRTEED